MQGLICPIIVRRIGDGYRLVDGLHRYEAFRILARETIPAILSDKESDDEARTDAVTANLARRISALDFCRHLFDLKEVWLRLHPETANGGNKNVLKGRDPARSRKPASGEDEPEITAFDGAMSDKFDIGRTQIKEAVAIWRGLSVASRARLHCTALAEKKTELKALSREKEKHQAAILQSVAEAIFHLENGVAPTDEERKFATVSRQFGALDDTIFDSVITAHEERVIASLKRRGRI
jgi:ParB family chromosome partitioning protein